MFWEMKRGRLALRPGLILPHISEVATLPPATGNDVDWSRSINGYTMMGNDVASCCTLSAAANARRQFGIYAGREPAITDADVLAEYTKRTGWPKADPGLYETDVLTSWMDTGLMFGGEVDKIDGFARINIDPSEVMQAIELFGGVMIGAGLPLSMNDQGLNWGVVPGPSGAKGSDGEHEMWVNACNADGFQPITWAEKVHASWDWFMAYVDDVQVVLSRDWTLPDGRSPAGVDWAALENAMAALPRFA
jgi:hypothetical protein